MDHLKNKLGERLKAARQKRNLSLDEAAKLTEISKPMLSQIERGLSMPTIATLWKISTGLKVPLSAFVDESESEYRIIEAKGQEPIVEEDGRMRAYTVLPYDPVKNFEMFYIEFDAGCAHKSSRHLDGIEEYLFVIEGSLELVLDSKSIVLTKHQTIRFRGNSEHIYINSEKEICVVQNIIFYPPSIN